MKISISPGPKPTSEPSRRILGGLLRTAKIIPKQKEDLDQLIESSFDEFVKKERRNTLLVSVISLFICVSKAMPTETSLLFFKINNLRPHPVYIILLTFQLYAITAFYLYASPQFRKSAKKWLETSCKSPYRIDGSEPLWSIHRENLGIKFRHALWVFFEFRLPFILSILAIAMLLYRLKYPN